MSGRIIKLYSGSTYNATYASNTGDNSTWNESYADEKYAYIIWKL